MSDLDRLIELEKECRRVGILNNQGWVNNSIIKVNIRATNLLNEYYINEWNYFFKLFENDILKLRWHLLHKTIDIPKCKYCGNTTTFSHKQYNDICSNKMCKSNKLRDNNIKKYGVTNVSKIESVKEKIRNSYLKKIAIVQEKRKETLSKRSEEEKANYGRKLSIIQKSRTDEQKKISNKKKIQTCLDKYGVEHPMKLDKCKEKCRQTCMEKYGVDNVSKSNIIKDKINNTNIEKYRVIRPIQNKDIREKTNKTCQEKYGGNSSFSSKEIYKKCQQTFIRKYGDIVPIRTKDYEKFRLYSYNGISFDSSYELVFYKYCIDHNIPIEYEPHDAIIHYKDKNNIDRIYHPDFRVKIKSNDNLLIEISSEYTWNYKKSEEKKTIIRNNNILVLLDKDLKKCFEYCKKIRFNINLYKRKNSHRAFLFYKFINIPPTTFVLEYKENILIYDK